jgi:hypothetical protein
MEYDFFNCTPYQRSNSGHEHLVTSMQSRKYSKKNFKTELQKKLKTISKSTREACSTQLRRARGLVRSGTTELCT